MATALNPRAQQLAPDSALFAALGQTMITALTGLSVVLMHLLSAMALYHFGLNYESTGGSFIEKVHPGSWLVFITFILAMLGSGNPLRYLDRVLARQPGTMVFLVTWLLLLLHIIFFQKMPFTPIIDTFLMPMLLLVLLRALSEQAKGTLARIMHLIYFVNALLGLYEYLTGFRLTPYTAGTLEITGDWRATSLFGHPLGNAILTGSYVVAICCGGARELPGLLRPAMIGLQLAAMVAFGGRTSLVFTLLFVVFAGGASLFGLLRGKRINLAGVSLAMVALPLGLAGLAVLAGSGFFDQLIQRFVDDNGSAKARLVMLHLFDLISPRDILLGPDPAFLGSLLRLEGTEYGLESFWLATILSYGLIVSLIFFAGLFAFLRDLVVASRPGAIWVLVLFFLIASTSVSLSAKTAVFGLIVSIMLILLRPDHKASTLRA